MRVAVLVVGFLGVLALAATNSNEQEKEREGGYRRIVNDAFAPVREWGYALAQRYKPVGFLSSYATYSTSYDTVTIPTYSYSSYYTSTGQSYTSHSGSYSTIDHSPCSLGIEATPVTVNELKRGALRNGVPSPTSLAPCGVAQWAEYVHWFSINGTGGNLTASTVGSDYSTTLSVYSCGSDNNVCVGAVSVACGSAYAQMTWAAEAGVTYYIALAPTIYQKGNHEFVFSVYTGGIVCPTEPVSTSMPFTGSLETTVVPTYYYTAEPCNGPIGETLELNQPYFGSTFSKHDVYKGAKCGAPNADYGNWFTFVGTDQNVTVDTSGSSFSTYIKVYECFGNSGDPMCVTHQGACGKNYNAVAHFFADEGETYYIFLSSNLERGDYRIAIVDRYIECVPEPTIYSIPTTAMDTITDGMDFD